MYKLIFKRLFDIILASIGLILLSPVFISVSILLFFANKHKVFFLQTRPGKHQKFFQVIKFKTMNDRRNSDGQLMLDKDRLTKVGRFVRKTSLDEIPQLINVLKGDMSLIGPRPLLIKYLPYYTQEERSRHNVLPGITGLAQVNGRNTVSWTERLAFDIQYVKSLSFKLDMYILFKTISNVFKGKDIVTDPESIMLNFDDERRLEDR